MPIRSKPQPALDTSEIERGEGVTKPFSKRGLIAEVKAMLGEGG